MAVYINKRGIVSTGELTEEELSKATATPARVFNGYTFYAGTDELQVGTALSTPITATVGEVIKGKTYYDDKGVLHTGTLLQSCTFITTSQWTCTLGPDSLPGGTYLGEDYQYQNVTIPKNANLAVIELSVRNDFDDVLTAVGGIAVNLKGNATIWEDGTIIIYSYGTGGSSYSKIDNVSIQNSTTLRMRCYTMTGQYSKVPNTIKVHFYS